MRKTRKVQWLGHTWIDNPRFGSWSSPVGTVTSSVMDAAIETGDAVEVRDPKRETFDEKPVAREGMLFVRIPLGWCNVERVNVTLEEVIE